MTPPWRRSTERRSPPRRPWRSSRAGSTPSCASTAARVWARSPRRCWLWSPPTTCSPLAFYSEELASAIPDAKLHVLSGGGHFAPVIVPDEYNAAVGAFLAGHRHL